MPRTNRAQTEKIVVVHDHDVLNGRGVNIAQHPGNQRFRALIKSHTDQSYCSDYSTSAKKALAEEIVSHIRNLDPPGRFLKRPPRVKKVNVTEGPWEELTDKETLKKTCQALRDCNRGDRNEYARHIEAPDDVQASQEQRKESGLTNREYAERMAVATFAGIVRPPAAPAAAVAEAPAAAPPAKPQQNRTLWVDTSAAAASHKEEKEPPKSSTRTAMTATMTPVTATSSGHYFPDETAETSPSGNGGEEDHHSVPGGHLAFGDHFTNSPSDTAGLNYDPFNMEEEQKLSAIAHQAFDDGGHETAEAILGRSLDESTDFTSVFDSDIII